MLSVTSFSHFSHSHASQLNYKQIWKHVSLSIPDTCSLDELLLPESGPDSLSSPGCRVIFSLTRPPPSSCYTSQILLLYSQVHFSVACGLLLHLTIRLKTWQLSFLKAGTGTFYDPIHRLDYMICWASPQTALFIFLQLIIGFLAPVLVTRVGTPATLRFTSHIKKLTTSFTKKVLLNVQIRNFNLKDKFPED